ncbi:hypothetical protein NK6_7749 [Bradyrhizobium diazoefficiens]|uniref:Uncharacterized protein n=1 Tax=Bradyrhizobium diazoefficiens TaxID=1355477 RepID=A0A0E3VWH1_9BRAD|nr:hypothetical protein NK6_7749 [Bradyrhizobium diazoefficiens]
MRADEFRRAMAKIIDVRFEIAHLAPDRIEKSARFEL